MVKGSAVAALPTPSPQPERVASIQRRPSRIQVAVKTSTKYLTQLYNFWERVQTSHCGQYSVERMIALDEYCQQASFTRVVLVCVATPLPSLAMVILAECLPLQPTAEGALANYVFWIRHASMVTLILLGVVTNAKAWIPDVPLTRRRIIGLSLGCSLAATALDVVAAHCWVFPLPFLTVLGGPVLLTIVAIALIGVVGLKALREIEDGGFHLQRYLHILSVQTSTMTIYPGYHALFVVAPTSVKRLLVLALPGVTLALKNTMVAHASHLEDRLPEVVVFSIDFFDAMYSVLCMRSASSLTMTAISVVVNSLVLTLSLKGMARRSEFAQGSWLALWSQSGRKMSSTEAVNPMATALSLLQTPGKLDSSDLNQIRLFSGGKLKLSKESTAVLDMLASRSVYNTDRKVSKTIGISQLKARYALKATIGPTTGFVAASQPRAKLLVRLQQAVQGFPLDARRLSRKNRISSSEAVNCSNKGVIVKRSDTAEENDLDSFFQTPVKAFTAPRASNMFDKKTLGAAEMLDTSFKFRPLIRPGISEILQHTRKRNTRTVNGTLQLLFSNEYLGLIAYTQCIIPIMYMVYMALLQALPNRVYYPEARNVGSANQLGDRMLVIGVLGLYQFLSLVALHKLVAARFSVSTLYQIAFVLETQAALVQGKVASSFIFAVGFPLEHYGTWAAYLEETSLFTTLLSHYRDGALFKIVDEAAKGWLGDKKSPADVLVLVGLAKPREDLLSTSLFATWLNYVKAFNKANPTEKVNFYSKLHAQYMDGWVEVMVAKAMTNPRTVGIAKVVQAERFKRFLRSQSFPDNLFVALQLSKEDNFLASRDFKLWTTYLSDFNQRYPKKKMTMIDALMKANRDYPLTKLLLAAKKNPSTENQAASLLRALMNKWVSAKKDPSEVSDMFTIRRAGSDGPSLLKTYVSKFNRAWGSAA